MRKKLRTRDWARREIYRILHERQPDAKAKLREVFRRVLKVFDAEGTLLDTRFGQAYKGMRLIGITPPYDPLFMCCWWCEDSRKVMWVPMRRARLRELRDRGDWDLCYKGYSYRFISSLCLL